MKDALGHGSNGTGAHSQGVQALPNMQRRHFEAIAAEFKSQPDVGSPEHLQRVNDMADKLATTNPGFRRDFFVKASTGGGYNNKSGGRTSGMSKAAGVIAQMRK